jgi:hypothetical protein
MIFDASLSLVPIGSPLPLVAAAGVAIPSAVIDLLGAGVGVAPPNIIGNASVFGTDFGIGADPTELNVTIGTACATANGATLNVQLQFAADNGAYQPGTWYTAGESGAIAAANLAANAVIARLPWLPAFPKNLQPRFARLNFVVPAATNFTAGTIGSALVCWGRDDYAVAFAAKNFSVS